MVDSNREKLGPFPWPTQSEINDSFAIVLNSEQIQQNQERLWRSILMMLRDLILWLIALANWKAFPHQRPLCRARPPAWIMLTVARRQVRVISTNNEDSVTDCWKKSNLKEVVGTMSQLNTAVVVIWHGWSGFFCFHSDTPQSLEPLDMVRRPKSFWEPTEAIFLALDAPYHKQLCTGESNKSGNQTRSTSTKSVFISLSESSLSLGEWVEERWHPKIQRAMLDGTSDKFKQSTQRWLAGRAFYPDPLAETAGCHVLKLSRSNWISKHGN